MRLIFLILIFLLSYPLEKLQALPTHCPQLDRSIIQSNQNQFSKPMGQEGELSLNGYRWRVVDAKNLDPSLGSDSSFISSSVRQGVTSHATNSNRQDKVSCSYDFLMKGQPVAQLALETDESMKLPEHSFERWSRVSNKADEAMEKEEEQVRENPRIRLE